MLKSTPIYQVPENCTKCRNLVHSLIAIIWLMLSVFFGPKSDHIKLLLLYLVLYIQVVFYLNCNLLANEKFISKLKFVLKNFGSWLFNWPRGSEREIILWNWNWKTHWGSLNTNGLQNNLEISFQNSEQIFLNECITTKY